MQRIGRANSWVPTLLAATSVKFHRHFGWLWLGCLLMGSISCQSAQTLPAPTSMAAPSPTGTIVTVTATRTQIPTPALTPIGEAIFIPSGAGEIDIKGNPQLMAAGEGAVWVLNVFTPGASVCKANERMLMRLDSNGKGTPVFKFTGMGDGDMIAAEGSVWITDPNSRTLTRFDIRFSQTSVLTPCRAGSFPSLLAAGEGFVWLSCLTQGTSGHSVVQIEPHSMAIVRTIEFSSAGGIAVGAGFVWVANPQQHTVTRIDPRSGDIVSQPIQLEQGGGAVQFGEGSIWVLDWDGGNVVTRIDPTTGTIREKNIPVGPHAFATTTGAGSVWVTNRDGGNVSRINAQTGSLMGQPIHVGSSPKGIAFFNGSVWVANFESGTVTRFTP